MLSHLKRRVGVIAAVAVLASLTAALSVSPASAVPQTALTALAAGDTATYSACPSGSVASAGMTDTTSTDVDCIAHYGITTGVTATTYEPSANVPRWQMALYLTRMADKTGHTLGSGADQGFTDISGYSAAIQTAINQIKQLGVTTGTTATTYSPDDNVTHEQMAMFLERLLGLTVEGPGGSSDTATVPTLINGGEITYNYDDIDSGSVTFEGHNAIVEIYNLGVTGHASTVRTFSPAADITRATMATWLANALAHTNARPAGLWIQSSTDADGFANNAPTLSISHRDSSHAVISGTIVDVFEWQNSTTTGNTSPWTSTGACNANVGITGNSLTVCKVELGDPTTNTSGNVADITEAVTDGKTRSYYAWTAATNTVYDNDLHGSGDSFATVSQSSAAGATLLTLTATNAAAAKITSNVTDVTHGTTVTISAQMSSAKNGSSYPAVAQAANLVTFTHTIKDSTAAVISVTATAVYTDATGLAEYSYTTADPTTTVQGTDNRTHEVVVSDASAATTTTSVAATGYPNHFTGANNAAKHSVLSQDTAAAFNTTTLAHNVTTYAAGTALAPVARNVVATNTDQYGNAWTTARTVQFQGASVNGANKIICTTAADLCHFQGATVLNTSADDEITINADDTWTLVAHGLSVGDAVTFEGALSPKTDDGLDRDTVYYVKTAPDADTFTTATVSSGGAITNTAAAVDDCTAVLCDLYLVPAHGLVVGDSVVFRGALSTEFDATFDKDTRYYVKTATAHSFSLATVSATGTTVNISGNAATPIDDCATSATDCDLYMYHASATSDRTTGPNGSASVAWNDSATTSAADVVSAYSSTTVQSQKTSYRTITPVVGTTISDDQTAIDITEESVGGLVAGSVLMTPLIWDDANNTLVIQVNHGVSNAAVAANTHTPALQSVEYLLYAYDSNDVFFNAEGATATSMAGFEGAYIAGGNGAYGLLGHQADGTGGAAFSAGDMQHIDYEVLPGNVSVFNLGS